jgi:hypothetical protein
MNATDANLAAGANASPECGNAALHGAADWLCLAAAPSFAIMALLTGGLGGGMPDMLCSAAHGASPLSGMVPMYLLMSAFHAAPWLKLVSRRRSESRHTCHSRPSPPGATLPRNHQRSDER